MKSNIYLRNLTYSLISIVLIGYLIILGKSILTPIVFAAIIAFMVRPISRFYEPWVKSRVLSILLTFITGALPIVAVITFFGVQLSEVITKLPSIGESINAGYLRAVNWITDNIGISAEQGSEYIQEIARNLSDLPMQFLSMGISSSTVVAGQITISIIFLFLFLLYRSSLKSFILMQYGEPKRSEAHQIIGQVQNVVQRYLFGLLLVILILGILNSIGLILIGIKYAFFWGFMAAFLAIIPYVGTFLGGLMPFLYSLATTDQWYQPVLVVLLFVIIQTLEGNYITPKVSGNVVKINPLAAIFALLFGNLIWGIAGMILAIPMMAIAKIIFLHNDQLRPFAYLLGTEINDPQKFREEFDEAKFRMGSFLRKKD